MAPKSCYFTTTLCALVACVSTFSQEPAPHLANPDILNMVRAGLPESTVLSEIDVLIGGGATFNISPTALVELHQAGASEKILNAIVWVQTTVVPGLTVPVPRGVFYRAGSTMTELHSFLLWPEFAPRWTTWPLYAPDGKRVAMSAVPEVVQVSEASPTLLVQGFEATSGWQLVKISRAPDHRELKLKRKSAFYGDFFSDSQFDATNLRPVTLASVGAGSFTARPASPLETGEYALCGQLERTWMRSCYEFRVTGM